MAPFSMEREVRVCLRDEEGRALAGMTSERGKEKEINTRSREQTQGCERQQ